MMQIWKGSLLFSQCLQVSFDFLADFCSNENKMKRGRITDNNQQQKREGGGGGEKKGPCMYRRHFWLLMVAWIFVLRVQRGNLQFHWWSSSLELESRYSFNPLPVLLSSCPFFSFGTRTKMHSLLWHGGMWSKGRRNNSIFCEIVSCTLLPFTQ